MNTTTKKNARRFRTVAAVAAVAVACSSGAYAAGSVISSSKQIKSNVVNTGDIKNGTVKVKDLNPKTVNALTKVGAWQPVTLAGSWIALPGHNVPSYRIDAANGTIEFKGAVGFGGGDTAADKDLFELPVGARPANAATIGVISANPFGDLSEFGAIEIQSDGDVRVYGESDDRFISLEGVSMSLS